MEDIMQKSMVIYLLTDRTNGMQYVGQTVNTLARRMKLHRYSNTTHVDKMIRTHGWENFTVEILEECATHDELNEREVYWIATLNTKHPNGYNMTVGGNGSPGYRATEEARHNMSVAHNPSPIVCVETNEIFPTVREAAAWAGVQKSAIHRACNGIAHSAGGHHWFYLNAPELADHEVKIKVTPNKRAIRCVETGFIFPSIREAARWAGVNTAVLIRICQGVKKIARGLHWEYCDEPPNVDSNLPSIDETLRMLGLTTQRTHHGKKRAVICIDTGQRFESIKEAAEQIKISGGAITQNCKGKSKTAGGFSWQYLDEYEATLAD